MTVKFAGLVDNNTGGEFVFELTWTGDTEATLKKYGKLKKVDVGSVGDPNKQYVIVPAGKKKIVEVVEESGELKLRLLHNDAEALLPTEIWCFGPCSPFQKQCGSGETPSCGNMGNGPLVCDP